ncbi:hypothetical protein [Parvibaculum sp.]|uniref:hypothetical protein n=1 Tax=Parvibaculum sp. TaxID=2024848 RepID=UPI001B086DF3|nr:hypothetical protein [Parvibaculum sp.]MBO6668182.1 hypothetical protein [Parvibaculum sp.]MBO6691716.1 hypothetical protein [Parvibaculum sp.]MBO6714700.1 hypothetical protein [Parvibaculum sp.]
MTSNGKEKQADRKNKVTEAEKESFPSSDPPAWTSGEASPEADAKRAERKAEEAEKKRAHEQECVDETLDESFPASDPPSWTGTHAGDSHDQGGGRKK